MKWPISREIYSGPIKIIWTTLFKVVFTAVFIKKVPRLRGYLSVKFEIWSVKKTRNLDFRRHPRPRFPDFKVQLFDLGKNQAAGFSLEKKVGLAIWDSHRVKNRRYLSHHRFICRIFDLFHLDIGACDQRKHQNMAWIASKIK